MNYSNTPRFTAEYSLYRCERQFHAFASQTPYAFAAEIIPQACIVLDGSLVCDIPGIPTDPRPSARCRAGCYHRYPRGGVAALRECLADC
jgi:hypothetical protein